MDRFDFTGDHAGHRGIDRVAIEAFGTQTTSNWRCGSYGRAARVEPCVHSSNLKIPLNAFGARIGDHKIVTALCPAGRERIRRVMGASCRTA